jgi:hypothetical protein
VLRDLNNARRGLEQVPMIRRQIIEQIQVGHPSTLDRVRALAPP